jgi:hypothetical protein
VEVGEQIEHIATAVQIQQVIGERVGTDQARGDS